MRARSRLHGSIVRTSLALGLAIAHSVSAHAERLPLKSYTTADGLARDQIIRIVRDSRGFLWFCTAEGLSRFDGYAFTNYTTANGLPNRSVRDLLETRSGVYWIATGGGVVRFDPGATRQPSKPGLVKSPARDAGPPMFEVHLPGTTDAARNVFRLVEDRQGRIWVGTWAGLYRLETTAQSVSFHPVDLGMPSTMMDDRVVEDLLEDRDGSLWVASRGSGLYRRRLDGHIERYTTGHGLPGNRVNALVQDGTGRLWAGHSSGLSLLVRQPEPNRSLVDRIYSSKDGLAGDWINALLEASDGAIWIAATGGLTRLSRAMGRDPPRCSFVHNDSRRLPRS